MDSVCCRNNIVNVYKYMLMRSTTYAIDKRYVSGLSARSQLKTINLPDHI